MQKSVKIFVYLISMVLLTFSVTAAFSTPYLENNTVRLNGTEEYEFEIVFQNTENKSTIMTFEVLNGNEWTDPDTFSIEIPGKTYDKLGSFKIMVPENVTVDGIVQKLEHNKEYEIQYTISSGNPGEGGMVPVTSKVKKTLKVVAVKENTKSAGISPIMLVVIIFIMAGIVYMIFKSYNKNDEDKLEEEQ